MTLRKQFELETGKSHRDWNDTDLFSIEYVVWLEKNIKKGTIVTETEAFKQGKRKGAASMAKLVRDMRQAQQRYFDSRSDAALKEAKKLEQQVDRAVEAVLR